ncbi:MAG: carboxypeptidase regulatory-like domain-containing protein [Planctomycetaceae bacterium]|nr:carboxypeptidase regulatory-like domain-containing protein [Planctomycetaceae bacterium]
MKSFTFVLAGVLAACVMTSCSTAPQANYEHLGLVQVSGNVTLDSQPLAGAMVRFEAPDGQYSSGVTDSNGHYTLRFDSEKLGATPGDKIVRISTAASPGEGEELSEEPPGEEGEEDGMEGASPKKEERVPVQFNKNSDLKRTVKPGENQTFDFDLKSN